MRVALVIGACAGTAVALKLQDEAAVEEEATTTRRGDSDCGCLKWGETYSSGMVDCGGGLEKMEHGVCDYKNWFPRMSGDYCAKENVITHLNLTDPNDRTTWCYVGAGCSQLNGGKAVNEQVAWKKCQAGIDKRLGDLAPADLLAQFERDGLLEDSSLSLMMAYPVVSKFEWSAVKGFFADDEAARTSMSSSLTQTVQRIVDSGKPMIICDTKGSYPHACNDPYSSHIVYGKQLWDAPHFGAPSCRKGC